MELIGLDIRAARCCKHTPSLRAYARQLSVRHLLGTLARFTEQFATRESPGPSLAARTALQPWGYFCFFVQWVCSRALSLCSGLASLLLWPQWPPLLWLCSCLARVRNPAPGVCSCIQCSRFQSVRHAPTRTPGVSLRTEQLSSRHLSRRSFSVQHGRSVCFTARGLSFA